MICWYIRPQFLGNIESGRRPSDKLVYPPSYSFVYHNWQLPCSQPGSPAYNRLSYSRPQESSSFGGTSRSPRIYLGTLDEQNRSLNRSLLVSMPYDAFTYQVPPMLFVDNQQRSLINHQLAHLLLVTWRTITYKYLSHQNTHISLTIS